MSSAGDDFYNPHHRTAEVTDGVARIYPIWGFQMLTIKNEDYLKDYHYFSEVLASKQKTLWFHDLPEMVMFQFATPFSTRKSSSTYHVDHPQVTILSGTLWLWLT